VKNFKQWLKEAETLRGQGGQFFWGDQPRKIRMKQKNGEPQTVQPGAAPLTPGLTGTPGTLPQAPTAND
jgi:hypothetical protein